jgi:hypothetical protein
MGKGTIFNAYYMTVSAVPAGQKPFKQKPIHSVSYQTVYEVQTHSGSREYILPIYSL